MLRALRRFLRSPGVVVAEVGAIAVVAAASTFVPQRSEGLTAASRFASEYPRLAPFARALGLDRVFAAWWFFALLVLAAISLGIVIRDQWARLLRLWCEPLTEASFRTASYRVEVERPAPAQGVAARAEFRTTGRLGLAGSPVFHVGLMLAVVAGLGRMLFAATAQVDLVEGEVLLPEPAAYPARWLGPLARPFALRSPIRLQHVETGRYPSGALQGLAARFAVMEGTAEREVTIAVNRPLDLGGERLYVTALHGPAVFLEVRAPGGDRRDAVMLQDDGSGVFEGSNLLGGGLVLKLRAEVRGEGKLPTSVELRALRDGALLFAGRIAPGEGVRLATGEEIGLAGLKYWVRVSGARDPSTWLAYAALFLVAAGALLMFALVRVDTAVVVTPTAAGRRVLVALRAQRFAPLFAERFERLVRRELGGGGS